MKEPSPHLDQFSAHLIKAAEENNIPVVTYFIKRDARVNSTNSIGYTPLHIAAKNDFTNIVSLLLSYGAEVDALIPNRETPLHFAVQNQNRDIIKILLKNNAAIHQKDQKGKSPIDYANKELVTFIHNFLEEELTEDELTTSAPTNVGKNTLTSSNITSQKIEELYGAIKNRDNMRVKSLLEEEPSLAVYHHTKSERCTESPLFLAVKVQNLKAVELLIAHGAPINKIDKPGSVKTPLHYAVNQGCVEIVKLLLENGANPNVKTLAAKTPLHYIAGSKSMNEDKDIELVKLLLAKGAVINAEQSGGWRNDGTPRKGKTPYDLAKEKKKIN